MDAVEIGTVSEGFLPISSSVYTSTGAEFGYSVLQYIEEKNEESTPEMLLDVQELDSSKLIEDLINQQFEEGEIKDFSSSGESSINSPIDQISVFSIHPLMSTEETLSSFQNTGEYALQIRGVPKKSRVETQLKLCIQVIDRKTGHPVTGAWKYLEMPSNMIVSSLGKRQPSIKLEDQVKVEGISNNFLTVEAGVICSSNPSKHVFRCFGCIQRERKAIQRKKKLASESASQPASDEPSIEEEQKKILQFYCNNKVDFSYGEAIIPTRITCYCRHHEEKNGFQIWITLKDSKANIIAKGLSSEVLITDDHKSKAQATSVTNEKKRPRLIKEEPLPISVNLLLPNTTEPSKVQRPAVFPPLVEKVIPTDGPISGGIEVTVLGNNFLNGLSCMFGPYESMKTTYWGPQTVVCVLPASVMAGSVPVTFRNVTNELQMPVMFTYKDDSDRLIMEMALQVVGMKLTGKLDDARKIAMKIVNSNQEAVKSAFNFGNQHSTHTNHKSIEESVLSCFSQLLDLDTGHTANLSLQNNEGQTLLMLAVIQGAHQLVKLLLNHGANVNIQDINGFTALHFACMCGYIGMVTLLLSESPAGSIDLSVKNCAGQTPIETAHVCSLTEQESLQSTYKSIIKLLQSTSKPNLTSPTTYLSNSGTSSLSPSLPSSQSQTTSSSESSTLSSSISSVMSATPTLSSTLTSSSTSTPSSTPTSPSTPTTTKLAQMQTPFPTLTSSKLDSEYSVSSKYEQQDNFLGKLKRTLHLAPMVATASHSHAFKSSQLEQRAHVISMAQAADVNLEIGPITDTDKSKEQETELASSVTVNLEAPQPRNHIWYWIARVYYYFRLYGGTYKAIAFVGFIILFLGLVLEGVIPLPQSAPSQQNYSTTPTDTGTTTSSSQTKSWSYIASLIAYFVISLVLVCGLAYCYRRVQKIKAIVVVLGIVFIVFGLSQLVAYSSKN